MSKITSEFLQEMLIGLDGVTPGPWDTRANLIRAIDGDDAIPIFESRMPWKKHRHTRTVVNQEYHNLAHIARCDPDTMRALIALASQALRSQGEAADTPFGHEYGEGPKLSDMMEALTHPAPQEAGELPQDVIDLVIAAREFWETSVTSQSDELADALDKALEAFAARVPYENEPAAPLSTLTEGSNR